MTERYYAVLAGQDTGIFHTDWESAQPHTEGSGALFKGFDTREEAKAFMNAPTVADFTTPLYTAFVDGSYYEGDTAKYGSSAVILKDSVPVALLSIPGDDPRFVSQRNVAGEVSAALLAMSWVKQHAGGPAKLVINHDYVGIAGWPIGWGGKSPLRDPYLQQYEKLTASDLKVQFHKVEAHTGVFYNEWADQLAKQAAGSPAENTKATANPFFDVLTVITDPSGLTPMQ